MTRTLSPSKLLAASLACSLILSAPGFAPYQALAAELGEGAGSIRVTPQTPVINVAPQLPGSIQLPTSQIPAGGIEANAPQAPAALSSAESLASAVGPGASADVGAQRAALDGAYSASKPGAAAAADAVEAKDSCASGGCPFAKLFGRGGGNGGNGGNGGGAQGATPAPARPAPSDVGPIQKAAMRIMALLWKITDRLIDARWDTRLPKYVDELYLYFNEQALRLNMWDANSQPSTDKTAYPKPDEAQQKYRTADGSYFDQNDPAMAKAGSRFNHLRKPDGPPNPEWDKMDPNPMVVSEKLMKRDRDANGEPIIKEIPANSWFVQIQDQLHDWFNHEQEPITDKPVSFAIPKGHPLAPEGGTMVLNRTQTDPTLPADYKGPAIHRNGETSPWDKSSLYGSSAEIQAKVRTFQGGHLKVGADGWLPDDAQKPGLPQTGFNNNMSVVLALHNTVWAHEHNFVADAIDREYKAKGVQLSDEELFQKARLRITAVNARNHTIPWTRWLFAGSDIGQRIMWADWYGFLGKRFKLAYMRWTDRHPILAKLTDPFIRAELAFGIPGTETQHYGVRYNFTEEFVDVYRLHQLIRDTYKVHHLQPNADGTVEIRILDTVKLRDMVGVKTQGALRAHSLEDWALTMGKQNVGELTINNMPDDLRNLTAQDGVKDGAKIDLGAIDVARTRERVEASTYAKFTIRLGEKAPRTFEELTGGDKEAAAKLREVYKKVQDVDFQIGILAERKPVGFALGNRQFKVFVLSAPGRLKNDRFLSSKYNAATYDQSGIDYVETNDFGNILARVVPGLKALDIEAMENPYAPYPEPGWLPKALSVDNLKAEGELAKTGKRAAVVIGASALGLLFGGPVVGAAALVAGGLAVLSIHKKKQVVAETAALVAQNKRERAGQPLSVGEDFSLGATNGRLFSQKGLDEAEFERVFRDFGALRGYVTAFDLARLREADDARAAKEGRGTWLSRLKGRVADKRRDEKLLALYADRVVWQDDLYGKRVAAISEARLRQVLEASRPKDAKALNERLQVRLNEASDRIEKAERITGILAALGGAALVHTPLAPFALGLVVPYFASILASSPRVMANVDLSLATIGLPKPFAVLFKAVGEARKSALFSRVGALAALDLGGMLAWKIAPASPVAAALLALASFGGFVVWRRVKAYQQAVELQKTSVYGILKEGAPQTPIADLPGKTALERHGRYFADGGEIATLRVAYRQLRKTSLPVFTSFMTSLLAQLTFGRKSQKNMPAQDRARLKPGFFNIWTPGLIDAQAAGNSRIWAHADMPNGTKHGDVDPEQFERLFKKFDQGRDYVTASDIERMSRANLNRDTSARLKRLIGNAASKRSFGQLMQVLADRVVWEDGKLVPAISKTRARGLFEGPALYDIARERGGDR